MVTRGITQLTTDTLPFTVIESAFPLLPLVRYPLWLTTVNRYHPRDSNGNIFRNVSVVRHGVSLVTILPLDLVLNSVKFFRGNSNVYRSDRDDLILNNKQDVEVGQWLWQVGVLDSKYTGVQVTGIAFTNKRGKVCMFNMLEPTISVSHEQHWQCCIKTAWMKFRKYGWFWGDQKKYVCFYNACLWGKKI